MLSGNAGHVLFPALCSGTSCWQLDSGRGWGIFTADISKGYACAMPGLAHPCEPAPPDDGAAPGCPGECGPPPCGREGRARGPRRALGARKPPLIPVGESLG